MTDQSTVRIGAGAGFAGDRIDPAVELAQHADLDYLVFECLGERTVALGQMRRRADPDTGYDPMLDARMRAVLPACRRNGTKIITNSGAANPLAAGRLVADVARDLGIDDLRIGVVTGDDVTDLIAELDPTLWETGAPLSQAGTPLVSANAYIGAESIRDALAEGADVVIAGRCADPSLYVGALAHAFGWDVADADIVGKLGGRGALHQRPRRRRRRPTRPQLRGRGPLHPHPPRPRPHRRDHVGSPPMKLDDLATARTGDKGDTLILAVFPLDEEAHRHVATHLSPDIVAAHFGDAVTGTVTRVDMPQLPGLVFRIPGVLGAGVTAARTLDGHGKCLSYHALGIELPDP